MVNSEKSKYSSPELDVIDLLSSDVIATSGPGGSDGNNGNDNRDDTAWT